MGGYDATSRLILPPGRDYRAIDIQPGSHAQAGTRVEPKTASVSFRQSLISLDLVQFGTAHVRVRQNTGPRDQARCFRLPVLEAYVSRCAATELHILNSGGEAETRAGI